MLRSCFFCDDRGEVHKTCKILDVIIPGSESGNKNNSKHDSSLDEEKSKNNKGVNSYYSNGLLIGNFLTCFSNKQ